MGRRNKYQLSESVILNGHSGIVNNMPEIPGASLKRTMSTLGICA